MEEKKRYIMALDQGTTSSRCILFDQVGQAVSTASEEFGQHYPKPGWVEHDGGEIWETQLAVARKALQQAGIRPEQVASLGLTNQRETVIVWDRSTGAPIYPAIVWQCRRTAEACQRLEAQGYGPMIRQKTGLPIDAYFSATKIQWILEQHPRGRELARDGRLAAGTVDSWLLWKLTGGSLHATDITNASRTMLFNIHDCRWDEELLDLFGVPAQMLPRVLPSSGLYGCLDEGLLGAPIPIGGVAGDQQAALFGQTCFRAGEAKNTYGTGCFLLMNTGREPVHSQNGLLTTVAWQLGKEVTYALEGSVFIAGAAIQWLRDELGLVKSAGETGAMAKAVEDTGGVFFVPAFVGLGAPHWAPDARGTILGLTRGSNKNHLVRAALEAIAYQTADVLAAMEKDAGAPLASLQADGGASANDFLMQFQADLIQTEVRRSAVTETTALGAAYLAGLSCGFWKDLEDIRSHGRHDLIYRPHMDKGRRDQLYGSWKKAVACALEWKKEEDHGGSLSGAD